MKKFLIILDAGHGGIINGKYTTAPAKQFLHPQDNSWAYEGVINRSVKNEFIKLLQAAEKPFVDVSSGNKDFSLNARVTTANNYNQVYSKNYNVLYLSIHSNASEKHNGRGLEIWTSPGQTKSDYYVQPMAISLINAFPESTLRRDRSDGDDDKESKFFVLEKTVSPAMLVELHFFDNWDDWNIIRQPDYYKRMAKALFEFHKYAEKVMI